MAVDAAARAAHSQRTWRAVAPIATITAVAALLRFWSIGFGLPHTYARPDEDAVVALATGIYGHGPNPHNFTYPTLYVYAVAFVYEVYYVWLTLAGQSLSAAEYIARFRNDPAP